MPENVKRHNLEKSIADGLRAYYQNKGLAIKVSANDVFVEQALGPDGSSFRDYCLEDCKDGQFNANGREQERHNDGVINITIESPVTFDGNFNVLGYDPIHKQFSVEITYAYYTKI